MKKIDIKDKTWSVQNDRDEKERIIDRYISRNEFYTK